MISCPFPLILSPLSGSNCLLLVGWQLDYIGGFEIKGISSSYALSFLCWPSEYSQLRAICDFSLAIQSGVTFLLHKNSQQFDIYFHSELERKLSTLRLSLSLKFLVVPQGEYFLIHNTAAFDKETVFGFSNAEKLKHNVRKNLWNINMLNLVWWCI